MRLAAAAVLFVILSAGCLAGVGKPPAPSPNVGATGWTPDCRLGSFEKGPWAQACEARASHNPGSKAEMWLAVNPKNPKNIVVAAKDLDPAASDHCVWNGVSVTHDAGQTWKDVHIGGAFAQRVPTSPFFGYACNTDPMFQFTKDGAVHYGVEMYDLNGIDKKTNSPAFAPGWKIVLATSLDGGDTWPTVVTYQPDLLVVSDYSRMTVNPVSQAILESIGSGLVQCHVMVSKDGGKSALFYNVATKDGVPCSSNNGAIAGSPKGVVVIVGNDMAARSTDDGTTWTDSNKVFAYKPIRQFSESKYRNGENLELAYDLSDGTRKGLLYAVYSSSDRDEADVFARTSTDDGKTWSEAVVVNQDPAGTHQWMPNVAVAGDSSVHVVYMDKQYDPEHRLIGLTHAWSDDGGKTWKNQRLSTTSYDGDLGVHQDGGPFIGDYLGVAAVGDEVWAGFPDASGGGVPVTATSHIHLVR
jgi:hypothetical protein